MWQQTLIVLLQTTDFGVARKTRARALAFLHD